MSFSTADLRAMQDAQEAHMMDACDILKRTVTGQDSHGYDEPEWAVLQSSACGFDPSVSDEVLEGAQVTAVEAVLRLPIGLDEAFTNLDRVQVTHRHGVALTDPPTFDIVGLPERGPSGLVLRLKRVTDGSDT